METLPNVHTRAEQPRYVCRCYAGLTMPSVESRASTRGRSHLRDPTGVLKRVGVTGEMRRVGGHEYPPASGSKTHGPRREGAGASCAEGLRLRWMGMTTGRAKVQTDPSCLRKAMVLSKPCWVYKKPVVAPLAKKMSARLGLQAKLRIHNNPLVLTWTKFRSKALSL